MEMFTENSSDLDERREDYKNELVILNARLKALNRDLDFSLILNQLLAETGPAITHVPKLYKQKMEDLAKRIRTSRMRHNDRTPDGILANGCRRRLQGLA